MRKRKKYSNPPDDQGSIAEGIVEHSLDKLKRQQKILDFVHAKQYKELDGDGIDFLIFLKGGLMLPLQIKSSLKLHGHFFKHPLINFVLSIEMRRTPEGEYIIERITIFKNKDNSGKIKEEGLQSVEEAISRIINYAISDTRAA